MSQLWSLVWGLWLAGFAGVAFAEPLKLPWPKKGTTLDALSANVSAVAREGKDMVLSFSERDFFARNPVRVDEKNGKVNFGRFSDAKAIKFTGDLYRGKWNGIEIFEKEILLFDGEIVRFALFDRKENTFLYEITLPWDLIRPPRDRGGEATSVETSRLRALMNKRFHQAGKLKFAGVALDRGGWLGKSSWNFFASTQLRDFPLVTIRCPRNSPRGCYVDRKCFSHGYKIAPKSMGGISVDVERRELLLTDVNNRRIVRVKFRSCFDSRSVGSIEIPEKIKNISNIYVDRDRRLWLSSSVIDDYYSASVYNWPDSVWAK